MIDILCCPICRSKLNKNNNDQYICNNDICKSSFPLIDNKAILINDNNSVFQISDFINNQKEYISINKNKLSVIKRLKGFLFSKVLKRLPSITNNLQSSMLFPRFAELLFENNDLPLVLVIGSGDIGNGLDTIIDNKKINFIETDVQLGSRVHIVCDAHDIPFCNETFDGVIIQAVLEHVCDPNRCVSEVYRVLKTDGIVYAETPFMQPGHKGRYDFTRFTNLGHRRLFRNYKTLFDGIVCGPGMALALSIRAFLWSFTNSKSIRLILTIFHQIIFFWLKYLDYILVKNNSSVDSASAFYFIGKKSNRILSDRELISLYKGANK